MNKLSNNFKEFVKDENSDIRSIITKIAKTIKIENFIENLETLNKYPELVERFIRHQRAPENSKRTLLDSVKSGIGSGSAGFKKAGYQYLNGKMINTFHIPFYTRDTEKFGDLQLDRRKKIIRRQEKKIYNKKISKWVDDTSPADIEKGNDDDLASWIQNVSIAHLERDEEREQHAGGGKYCR